MELTEALTYGAQALLFGIAIYVGVHTLAYPTRSNFHILAFFSLLALIIAYVWVKEALEFVSGPSAELVTVLLIITLPYVLLRLADKFSSVPHARMRLAEIGLVISYLVSILIGAGNPLVLLLLVSYFAVVSGYSAYRFHAGTHGANGITQKRLRALSIASIVLGAAFFTVIINALVDGALNTIVNLVRQVMLVGSGVMFLIGFAPPRLVRRAWQEPAMRHFLYETLRLPRWPSMDELLRHLEDVTAHTVGAPHAAIGIWNPESELLEFENISVNPGETIRGRSFLEQRAILSLDTVADDPASREIYEWGDAYAVMVVPINTKESSLGVIALNSPNPPIFAEDDLQLLGLLADQIALLLENRRHLEAQAELAAREETTRLKDEFLSVAAHDLKTPLTTILATGQYLERRLSRSASGEPEIGAIQRLNRESKRLRSLVQSLLDASRIERGQLVTSPEPTDLAALIHDVIDRTDTHQSHQLETRIEDGLNGLLDGVRIQQVLENLLENARKYSPPGSTICVSAWSEDETLRISVSDDGVGIAPDERDKVFDRYFRSLGTTNGSEPGIGLGLHICREIVQQHGGQIWAESEPGHGSTFHVSLKSVGVAAVEHGTADTHR